MVACLFQRCPRTLRKHLTKFRGVSFGGDPNGQMGPNPSGGRPAFRRRAGEAVVTYFRTVDKSMNHAVAVFWLSAELESSGSTCVGIFRPCRRTPVED